MWDNVKKKVYEIFSEPGPNGTLSWGRIGSTVTLLTSVYVISGVFIRTHHLDGIDWRGIAEYVTAPYASNKIATAVQMFSKKD